jgi:hypothetical protein
VLAQRLDDSLALLRRRLLQRRDGLHLGAYTRPLSAQSKHPLWDPCMSGRWLN